MVQNSVWMSSLFCAYTYATAVVPYTKKSSANEDNYEKLLEDRFAKVFHYRRLIYCESAKVLCQNFAINDSPKLNLLEFCTIW